MRTTSTLIATFLLMFICIPSRSQTSSYGNSFISTSGMIICKLTDGPTMKNYPAFAEYERGATFDISVYKGDDGTLHVRVLGENKVDVALYIHNAKGEEFFYEPVSVGGNGEIIYSLSKVTSGTCTVTANRTSDKKEVIKKSINF